MELKKAILLLNIFLAGFVVIALEIVGIRILASAFGYSIFVWGTIIGIILVSLSIGYFFGGILADRGSGCKTIYFIILASNIYLGIAIVMYKIFLKALSKWDPLLGISIASIILLVPPSILLSMVPPIATKSLLKKNEEGRTIGNIYALSNLGSIMGVFITTFALVPFLGSKFSLIICFSMLALFSLAGLKVEKAGKKIFLLILILSLVILCSFFAFASENSSYVLLEAESAYNVIQVKESGNTIWLVLNSHPMSYKEPEENLELYFYDAAAVLPAIMESGNFLDLGFAGGNVARKINKFFPDVEVEGVEIDGKVVEIAKEYFGVQESEKLKIYVEDARLFLQNNDKKYKIIFNNAINAKFIPFHLVSREFFELVDERLDSGGVFVNYSFYNENGTMLKDSIGSTMCGVFPTVLELEFPLQKAALLFGFKEETTIEEFRNKIDAELEKNANPEVKAVIEYYYGVTEFDCSKGEMITDDKNPIDYLTLQQII